MRDAQCVMFDRSNELSAPLRINTRVWLAELSKEHNRSITLAEIPEGEFQKWQCIGFTHIWRMGVWTSGPRAQETALRAHSRLEYSEALPDLREEDVGASPYGVAKFELQNRG